MPACTSTSNTRLIFRPLYGLLLALACFTFSSRGYAAEPKAPRTDNPEEEDFSSSPFTEYGEFNEEADEANDTRFFQYGRFFGVSLGAGFEGVTGNRGLLWQGGFPGIDFKVHYWFDFNFALDLGIYTVNHNYEGPNGHVDVSMFNVGLDLKYYFDTRNLSAPITFVSPYVLAGFGSYAKTETNISQNIVESDNAVGPCAGAGLEFTLSPRKVYFSTEGKLHFLNYKDTNTTNFQTNPGLPNLTGVFYTVMGSFLFTW